jgi:hypothetical protein
LSVFVGEEKTLTDVAKVFFSFLWEAFKDLSK